MTTVCAVARDGVVVMGADSMTNVYDRPVYGVRKIARVDVKDASADPANPTLLLGIAGDGALANLVNALSIDTTPTPDEPCQPWANTVASALTEILVEAGCTENGRIDGNLLLGWRGQLWTISHHQAIPHLDGVAALGAGEGPAIGCLDYGLRIGNRDLAQLVAIAVGIGIDRDKHSGGDITIETIGPVQSTPAL